MVVKIVVTVIFSQLERTVTQRGRAAPCRRCLDSRTHEDVESFSVEKNKDTREKKGRSP